VTFGDRPKVTMLESTRNSNELPTEPVACRSNHEVRQRDLD
jgi:hypothetical protein